MSDFMLINYLEILSFERPWFMIFALQPLILIFLRRMRMHSLSKYAEKRLWPWSINISVQHFKTRKLFQIIAWLLLAIAVSGPRIPNLTKTLSEHDQSLKSDVSIMFIADINGITKSEYNGYLIKLTDFIDQLNGEKIGFVALTSSSALISPLTNDYSVSNFYLNQMFDVVTLNPRITDNDLNQALKISQQEIINSKATTGIIIYWSDFKRHSLKTNQILKTRTSLEEIAIDKIKVIPVWNLSADDNANSNDITSIFGESASEFSSLLFQDIYEEYLEDLKSLTLFDTSKNHSHQQLYSVPLILGIFLLLISFIPFQVFNRIMNES
jgi:hypothetical protein